MAVNLTDKITYKRLVAAGNDQFWYGGKDVSAGVMAELTASRGDIDTSDQLIMFEGFQKVFVVNGANKKVADFMNSKVYTTAIDSDQPPTYGMVLTGATSSAKMVVDFLTNSTGSAAVYGYKTTSSFNFQDGEVLSNSLASCSFTVVSAVNSATPPHWYTWTPFGNDIVSYGSMPDYSYIGCLYRGRTVLAGNPNEPNQWYMSKVANPWNWLYSPTDPLTAIKGGNADAGQVGDIIRALIPYGDDYMVMGCANSMHILSGDPAAGGAIDRASDTTGIFGQYAWCKDLYGNMYFWGQGGLNFMESGRGKPVNISRGILPNWTTDWALDPSTHRIVLGFDVERHAVRIYKTVLATGSCVGYFYDLTMQGFYPEDYPATNGVYCACNYDANSPTYRGLLVGGRDGYIRVYDNATLDDEVTSGITTIDSYVALPVKQIASDPDREGKLTSMTIEAAGGVISGTFGDCDPVNVSFYTGEDSETVLEDIKDGATAFLTLATISAGRQTRIRDRIRGRNIGIKFSQNASGVSWAINRVFGEVKETGKVR